MSVIGRFFNRREKAKEENRPLCPHSAMAPRWDKAEDMGKEEAISSFTCPACGRSFNREEGLRIRTEEAKRLMAEIPRDEG